MTQQELKDKYMKIITEEVWPRSKSMQDYAKKNAAYIVELNNGDIVEISKPDIQKDFCFGYGYCGVSTEEDYKNAASMREHARTNQDYFIEENLKGLNQTIEELRDKDNTIYKYVQYCSCKSGCKLKGYTIAGWSHAKEYEPWRYSNCVDLEEMTSEEREALAAGYEEVKKAFIKRLNTYLKKYGLSKVRSWTYLSD